MAQIVPKLNLNKTPSIVEPNSLVFAKNIRLDVDGSIHRDYGVFPMSIHKGKFTTDTVNYKNLLNRIITDIDFYIKNTEVPESYIVYNYDKLRYISGEDIKDSNNKLIASKGTHRIVGVIPNNNEFYIFINGTCVTGQDENNKDIIETHNIIVCYDEKEDRFYSCNCNWSWSGGTITGCVINNLLGEKILNIGESNATTIVPLKCINLKVATIYDDEQLYTQTPNIPITNLNYLGSFNYVIPNGVYQFFVRYKIRDNFYTDWFPASKELFVGNKNVTDTSFGTVKYVNTHRDSDNSFKFSVEHLFINQTYNYKSFQIGFIISHDDAIVARAWKHFDFKVRTIDFDYNAKDAYEIEVIDLLKSAYQIYDVKNITSFKNKLYISNYKETNFNENLQDLANKIGINIRTQTTTSGYDGYPIIETNIQGNDVISGLRIGNEDVLFSGENGIINRLLDLKNNGNNESIKNAIADALNNDQNSKNDRTYSCGAKQWSIALQGTKMSLRQAELNFENNHSGPGIGGFTFYGDITKIDIDGDATINVSDSKENILNNILSKIYSKNRYLNKQCKFINGNGVEDIDITITITRKCAYTVKTESSGGNSHFTPNTIDKVDADIDNPLDEDGNQPQPIFKIGRPNDEVNDSTNNTTNSKRIEAPYDQIITLRLEADLTKYKDTDSSFLINYTTLIPYQQYKFYIHYVKQNGEITNGYYCNGLRGGLKTVPFRKSVDSVIYPEFTNIELPKGYVACFFSIVHVGNIVATVFDINSEKQEARCIDINVGLVAGSDNITIKQGYTNSLGEDLDFDPNIPTLNPSFPIVKPTNPILPTKNVSEQSIYYNEIKTNTAKYHYSSDTSDMKYFGADGIITFEKNSGISNGKVAYIVNRYTISEAEDTQLTKCTPFINPLTLDKINNINIYSNFDNVNLLGYICAINPLDKDRTINYYTDGSSVYLKHLDNNNKFILKELKNHLGDISDGGDNRLLITSFNVKNTPIEYIYSNYNLNYLTLSEEPIENYKSYYNNTSENTTEKSQPDGSIILRLFKSLMMSSTYTLPEMYKTYTKKTYIVYKKNEITEFNNTIRASRLEGDESSINIYKFDPNDYYNIPTNRGIIVNTISVGDAILVHTEDSMFKFSGSNTIQSSDGEIQPTENNVFDTGVSEVFGSDFGFAGLQYKNDHIVTENGYIFFDRDSRVVYMYSGQGQIIKLSDSIEKLFKHRNIEHIRFANDYYNNRFFMSIMFYETYTIKENDILVTKKKYYPVTLSFNISENIKSFVSLHDFYYTLAFNTKTKCYFITQDDQDICNISKDYKSCYTKLELPKDELYIGKKDTLKIPLVDKDKIHEVFKEYNINSYFSIIDIINNTDYEMTKTLNAVLWIGTKVISEFQRVLDSDDKTLNMVQENIDEIPCKYIRVYSDTCMSPLCDCSKKSNDETIYSLSYPKYPFYNQGNWTFNYFRNILNSNNHKYNYSSDDNSLIEGKYFVVRFIFDSDFKMETLSLNYNIK